MPGWKVSNAPRRFWQVPAMANVDLWLSPNPCRWLHLHPVIVKYSPKSRWNSTSPTFFQPKKLGPPKPHWKGAQNPHPRRQQRHIISTQQVLNGWTKSSTVSPKRMGLYTGLAFWQLIPWWWSHLRLRKFWIPSTWFKLYIMTLGLNTHPNGRAWAWGTTSSEIPYQQLI